MNMNGNGGKRFGDSCVCVTTQALRSLTILVFYGFLVFYGIDLTLQIIRGAATNGVYIPFHAPPNSGLVLCCECVCVCRRRE